MAPSTRQTLRLVMKPTPAHALGPARSSGVRKSSKRISVRKPSSLPNINAQRFLAEKPERPSSADAITAMMASMTLSKQPTKRPRTEHRERPSSLDDVMATMASNKVSERPTERFSQSAILSGPPITLPLPPTKLEASPAAQPEIARPRHTSLNCRYKLPNSYLTVYHRRGHRMLCMPWEMPWLEAENGAI